MISKEYNSAVRQTCVKNYLGGVRLNKFVGEGLTESEALENVNKHSSSHISATSGLEAALHLQMEAKMAVIRDSATRTSKSSDGAESKVPGILYQGQGRYLNRYKGVGNRSKTSSIIRPQTKPSEPFDPLKVMGCFNCDDPNHTAKQCPKSIDVTKAAKRKMEYYSKKNGSSRNAHIVLFELCKQLDYSDGEPAFDSDEENGDKIEPDVDLFEALISYTAISNTPHTSHVPVDVNSTSCPVEVHVTVEGEDSFNGACFDRGAQRSVVGRAQAEDYMGIPLIIKADSPRVYKFSNQQKESIGKAKFRIPYAAERNMVIDIDVVDINVPLLIGLDIMDEYEMMVDTVDNRLVCNNPPWSAPLIRKLGHIYYEWDYETMYSEQDLKRIHRHFYHPQPEKIYSLMRIAGDPNANSGTLQMLNKLTRDCDVCQRLSKKPGRFRVSLPNEDIVFNRLVLMDLMKLESKTVLHIICKDTLFSVAVFLLSAETTADVWQAYIRYWVNPYVGYSKSIHADQGPQFKTDEWRTLLNSCSIERYDCGIESHKALDVGERYHAFLRQIFRKVRAEHASIHLEDALSLAVNSMNCTAGPNGLSPTLLVFGVVPQFPSGFSNLPGQRERIKAMKAARDEMTKTKAAARLKQSSRRNVPGAADDELMIGMDVLLYRESPVNEWGPYTVVDGDSKNVWLNINGKLKLASVNKAKDYRSAYEETMDTEKVRELPTDIGFPLFRSVRAAFGWLAHSRPDICCAINRTEKKQIKELNEAIRRVKQSSQLCLKFSALDLSSLHLLVYADASFASNEDSSSQLGYIILLCDKEHKCHVLGYSRRKSKRVVRSIMAGEVYAFYAAFYRTYVIKHDLERILDCRIPLSMFTDSKQIFDVITRASHITEKRLMIDIAATREAYNRNEICNVGLVPGGDNPADGLTKPGFCDALFHLLETGLDNTPVVQWIYRINEDHDLGFLKGGSLTV